MVYMDGDNDTESQLRGSLEQLRWAGSTHEVNIVVMLDGDGDTGGWLYYISITPPFTLHSSHITLVQNLLEPNMGDPNTLVNFITWAESNYPAKKYALCLCDHGAAWHGVCSDWTSGPGILTDPKSEELLTTVELKTALSEAANSGSHIDLIGLDGCVTASTEVAYQIKDCCDVMVGSEQGMGDFLPYDTILSALDSRPGMSPAQLGTMMCRKYYAAHPDPYANQITLSEIDLTKMGALASSINSFSDIMLKDWYDWYNSYNFNSRQAIIDARANTKETLDGAYPYPDLYSFASNVYSLSNRPNLKKSAQTVMAAIKAAVICNLHRLPDKDCHGLNIYFPLKDYIYLDTRTYNISYDSLDFTNTTGWQWFLIRYING